MPIVQLNGQGIFYEDTGGNQFPLIFMHGFLFDTSMFDSQVEALSSDYRCIRFDARGFGQTVWDGKPFTLYDTAADCIALMDHLNLHKAVIVGMSQGGYAAVRVAVKYPERVKAVVFLSTYNGVDTDDVKATYRSMRDAWFTNGPDSLIDTFATLFLGPKDVNPQLWETWQTKWKKLPKDNVYHAYNNLVDRDEVKETQVREFITMPTLVVHGEKDIGMPSSLGEALFKSLPNAKKFVIVPEAAHAANLVKPDVVNAAMREFLKDVV